MDNGRTTAARRGLMGLAALAACCGAAGPTTAPGTLTVDAGTGHPVAVSADELRSRFAAQLTTVTYESHGHTHAAHAVPLLAVLQSAGAVTTLKMDPKADPRTKNLPLRLSVVVRGRDGYAATFALAELLPDVGDRPVWLAVDADGQPLADRAAPAELISPADAKPGRWVRGVAAVTVVDPLK